MLAFTKILVQSNKNATSKSSVIYLIHYSTQYKMRKITETTKQAPGPKNKQPRTWWGVGGGSGGGDGNGSSTHRREVAAAAHRSGGGGGTQKCVRSDVMCCYARQQKKIIRASKNNK
jgi:hypothetical protein